MRLAGPRIDGFHFKGAEPRCTFERLNILPNDRFRICFCLHVYYFLDSSAPAGATLVRTANHAYYGINDRSVAVPSHEHSQPPTRRTITNSVG